MNIQFCNPEYITVKMTKKLRTEHRLYSPLDRKIVQKRQPGINIIV